MAARCRHLANATELFNASPLNYGRWVDQNSGAIFRRLWTKVHQIKFACVGASVVRNVVFRLTTRCVPEIFAMKSRHFLVLGRQISAGRGPQISDQIS